MNGFTEKDWTLFKSKIAIWQEAYINKLNAKYLQILNAEGQPSEKFWHLEKCIKSDKKSVGVAIEMSRSELIFNIVSLIKDGVVSIDDIEEFSDELKQTVKFIIEK